MRRLFGCQRKRWQEEERLLTVEHKVAELQQELKALKEALVSSTAFSFHPSSPEPSLSISISPPAPPFAPLPQPPQAPPLTPRTHTSPRQSLGAQTVCSRGPPPAPPLTPLPSSRAFPSAGLNRVAVGPPVSLPLPSSTIVPVSHPTLGAQTPPSKIVSASLPPPAPPLTPLPPPLSHQTRPSKLGCSSLLPASPPAKRVSGPAVRGWTPQLRTSPKASSARPRPVPEGGLLSELNKVQLRKRRSTQSQPEASYATNKVSMAAILNVKLRKTASQLSGPAASVRNRRSSPLQGRTPIRNKGGTGYEQFLTEALRNKFKRQRENELAEEAEDLLWTKHGEEGAETPPRPVLRSARKHRKSPVSLLSQLRSIR